MDKIFIIASTIIFCIIWLKCSIYMFNEVGPIMTQSVGLGLVIAALVFTGVLIFIVYLIVLGLYFLLRR